MQTVLSASTELAYYGIEGRDEKKRRGHLTGQIQQERASFYRSGRQWEAAGGVTDAHRRAPTHTGGVAMGICGSKGPKYIFQADDTREGMVRTV